MFNTPILFLVFNRPDKTKRVFEAIRNVKPTQLFVSADGPRVDVLGEKDKCELVRAISTSIDWDCNLRILFRDENLGCGKAVSEGISWFFENVEEGIILEDDCLPNPSFFLFCQELLERYRDNAKITHISGNNFQLGKRRGNGDYFFSNYTFIWGWATWRRAWEKYDYSMRDYELLLTNYKYKYLIQREMMQAVKYGQLDTWDVQWQFTNFYYYALAIQPKINLVKNIGFSVDATHTKDNEPESIRNSKFGELTFPLRHPKKIKADFKADLFTAENIFKLPGTKNICSIPRHFKLILKSIIRSILK
jgi:hypothetical protein